jgi:hypothetical protein
MSIQFKTTFIDNLKIRMNEKPYQTQC